VGSSGGTLVTVTGAAFGTDETLVTVNLKHMPTNQLICESTMIIGYGAFTCQTMALDILATDEIQMVVAYYTRPCVAGGSCSLT